jgi:hypothetical protein
LEAKTQLKCESGDWFTPWGAAINSTTKIFQANPTRFLFLEERSSLFTVAFGTSIIAVTVAFRLPPTQNIGTPNEKETLSEMRNRSKLFVRMTGRF